MIYLKLFLTFFKIGAVSFGGGYGMISLIREEVISNGWLTEEKLLNMIAVSESTPGPIAVNIATFIGSNQAGILGSFFATLGVVTPSFIIILLIAALIHGFLKYKGVQAFLSGVRPCVVGLIFAAAITMFLGTVLGFKNLTTSMHLDIRGLGILVVLFIIDQILKRKWQKKLSPIMMIIFSACMGMLVYAI
jgi:chromate transporter